MKKPNIITSHDTGMYPNRHGMMGLQFRLWSGLAGRGKCVEQEHKIQQAEIACLHEEADDLYFTGKAVLETQQLATSISSPHSII